MKNKAKKRFNYDKLYTALAIIITIMTIINFSGKDYKTYTYEDELVTVYFNEDALVKVEYHVPGEQITPEYILETTVMLVDECRNEIMYVGDLCNDIGDGIVQDMFEYHGYSKED